jgi:uncharacterized protein YeaO (DUF488 family)
MNNYTLYTTYLSKMKHLPEGIMTAIIMRIPPMSIQKMENVFHCPELSPTVKTLKAYKATGDWDTFVEKFKEQMYTDEETMNYINLLMEGLEHNDVAIVCCEKNNKECHRSLIAEYLKELGYNTQEL